MARVASKKARAPNDANRADRSQEHRPKPSPPIEANCADRSQLVDRSHLHRNHCVARSKPIAPNEAGRAEGKAKKPTARRGRKSKGSSGGTCFFGDDEDDSEG